MITLKETRTGSEAQISTTGASLVALTLAGCAVIEPLVSGRPEFYAGVVMAPWSGRVPAGKWTDPQGIERLLDINEPARNNSLHGLVYDKEFEVKRSTESSVELTIQIDSTPSYPYKLNLAIAYELDGGELYSSFAVRNFSSDIAPFGIGFHPYLSTGWATGKVLIESLARTTATLNENLIAIGSYPARGTDKDLSQGKEVLGAVLDDSYSDLKFSNGMASAKLVSDNMAVELWQDDVFQHTVIYTPSEYPAPQGSITAIAIEPCTSAINALNTKEDLLLLAPGETRSGSWGIRLA